MYNYIHKTDYSKAEDIEISFNQMPFYMLTNFKDNKSDMTTLKTKLKFTVYVQDRHNE